VSLDPRAVNWFATHRGISQATLEAFGIQTEGRDLIFPYGEGIEKRRWSRSPDDQFGLFLKDERVFTWRDADGAPVGKGNQRPFLPPDFTVRPWVILAEGESDTMATYQNIEGTTVSVMGLSGLNAWKDEYVERLEDAAFVFVAIDNDDPYENPAAAGQGEKEWEKIRKALGRKARRVKLPQGCKDLAEFFQQYSWAALNVLLTAAAEPRRHYPRLDLTKPAPPINWLVDRQFVAGEATAIVGDGGSGKSFFMQKLAIALAGGEESFCGFKLNDSGPVLYVDEENSSDLVLQRLEAFGMSAAAKKNLEYISYAGVDLNSFPELLLEEALDIRPVLIVLDSLSKVGIGLDENSNSDMTKLVHTGILPLARESGACVAFIHHTAKGDPNSARGASAIRNSADQAITLRKVVKGGVVYERVNVFPEKSRRHTASFTFEIVGELDEGEIDVIDATPEEVM